MAKTYKADKVDVFFRGQKLTGFADGGFINMVNATEPAPWSTAGPAQVIRDIRWIVWRQQWSSFWSDLAAQLIDEEADRLIAGKARSCWAILGLPPGCDERAVKRAYARLVRRHPPEGDAEAFQRIVDARDQALEALRHPAGEDLRLCCGEVMLACTKPCDGTWLPDVYYLCKTCGRTIEGTPVRGRAIPDDPLSAWPDLTFERASGEYLDRWGVLMGVLRNGDDDETYRERINATTRRP